jgi:hypothetical protein
MRANVATVFLLLILAAMVANGQNPDQQFYPFARYPAERIYKGEPVAPKLITPTQRQFKTVLRKGEAKGPNFAGHYSVVEWGCGSNCVSFAVVDVLNGNVYDTDLPPVNDEYPCGLFTNLKAASLWWERAAGLMVTVRLGFTFGTVHASTLCMIPHRSIRR